MPTPSRGSLRDRLLLRHLDKDTNTFIFTPHEALLVQVKQWPRNEAVDLMAKLVTMRAAAEAGDASHLSSPNARRQFEDERQVRIGRIDTLTDEVSAHAQEQLAQEAAIFLRGEETSD